MQNATDRESGYLSIIGEILEETAFTTSDKNGIK